MNKNYEERIKKGRAKEGKKELQKKKEGMNLKKREREKKRRR